MSDHTQRYTRQQAIREARHMRTHGWPGARAQHNTDQAPIGGDWIIVTHQRGCTCGMCPMVRDDGYVR